MKAAGKLLLALATVSAVIAAVGPIAASGSSESVWLTTRTAAAHDVHVRFHNAATVACSPDTSSATRMFGQTRYWQRFWCSGNTYDHIGFKLRFSATGQCGACWTITNLSGISAAHLRVRHSSTSTSTTSPQPTSTSCGSAYYRNSDGHCVLRPTANPPDPAGATAQCVDGTYSYSEHASGTCSHHGGVARWINHP